MKILCITPIKHLKGVYESLGKEGDIIYKPQINKKRLSEFLKKNNSVDLIFCNPNKQNYMLDGSVLEGSSIKVIFTASTGINHIDLTYCKRKKILVESYKTDKNIINRLPSTSELAVGLMISLIRNIPNSFDQVKRGEWDYEPFIGRELASLSLGIIGYGRLGRFMAKFCKGLGMKVFYFDPYVNSNKSKKVTLKKLIDLSDVISIHVHSDKKTKNMINESIFKLSHRKPYIINTSRGDIVNERDIYKLLKKKIISGYATDVLEDEFNSINKSPILLAARNGYNVIITPHIGGMTYEGSQRAWLMAVKKISKIKNKLFS